jgi:hypothetical protein
VIGYSRTINLLDYSSVVIPVTKVGEDVDAFNHEYKPLTELDKKNWEACKSPCASHGM